MDVRHVSMILSGMADSMKTIESIVELKSQTNRVRNIINSSELDGMLVDVVVALRELDVELKEAIKK